MASLNFLAAAIVATFVVSSTLAVPSNNLNAETSPATSSELPPDIAPLFPSTGGAAYPPAGSIMPTIPSTRSPPNPDIIGSTGLDTAFGPSGSLQDSSAMADQALAKVLGFDAFLAFSLVVVFIV